MPLVQVRLQLGLHDIFTNKRTVNLWMHRVVVAARILSNQVLSGPILVDTDPYNSTIINFIKGRAMRACNDVNFLLYAKISASIQDFGEKCIQSDVYKRSPILYWFVGVLLAISSLGVNYYLAISNTADGYAYQTELKAMLEEWATPNTVHTVVLSAEMEQREWANQEIGNSAHVNTKNVNSGHVDTFNVNSIVK
ncbi:hypothetical protein DSO57_1035502 [Entomophthora muscae]|uniref:Uncharacterized protein n=1 Tax=Entomophthora muscae TaxID=34485 RepID=A0ACC2RE62_9FUNG|nr:hypothetical protein DSO57_1035502 [Entomophthora muscae]